MTSPPAGARRVVERHVGIGEAPVVDGDALADQSLDRVDDVPDVDVHAGHDAVAGQPEGDELARRRIAAEDDAIPVAGEARRTPCRRRTGRRRSTAGGRRRRSSPSMLARRRRPLVQRVGPVLDADPLAVERVLGVGDVAGGEHARARRCCSCSSTRMPFSTASPARSASSMRGLHADADDDEVAVDRRAVAGAHALDGGRRPRTPPRRCRAASARRGRGGCRGRTRRPRRPARAPAGPTAGRARSRSRPRCPRRRGDLGADPAGADHDDRAAAVEPRPQRVGVRDAAQVEHAVELAARDGEPPRLGAGGEQQPVVAQPLAVVERELVARQGPARLRVRPSRSSMSCSA